MNLKNSKFAKAYNRTGTRIFEKLLKLVETTFLIGIDEETFPWIREEDRASMETIEIFGISEERLLGILNTLQSLWKYRRESLDPFIELLFDKFGNKDDLLFAVQAYTHPASSVVIVLLTEYLRDLETASFIIYAYNLNPFGGVSEATWSARRLRDILEDCIEADLGAFSHLKGDELFVCPKCSARYSLRTLRLTRDGRVECQNCGRIVEYIPFEKEKDTNSNT